MAQRTPQTRLRLLTVGHGTASRDEFIHLVSGAGVQLVVDVRSAPGSRRSPQFGRAEMQAWLPAGAISYRWEPRLGGFRHPALADLVAGGLPLIAAELFDRMAARYDAWYDGPAAAAVLPAELACLRPLLVGLPRPWAETGAGSGRFAAALGVDVGLDPARAPLALAASRGVHVVRGLGERMPFRSGALGAALIVATLCFADDPAVLLAEARRVIRDDGAVVLGEIFADSAWGRFYRAKGARGHPFYSAARFLTRDEATALVSAAGLRVQAARSTLCQPPTDTPEPEAPRDREAAEAGFVAWRAVPTEPA